MVDLFDARGRDSGGFGSSTSATRSATTGFDLVQFLPVDAEALQVGGMVQLKRWLTLRQQAFDPRAREFGLPQPMGMLLLGLPGCGKRHITRAFAHVWKFRMARLKFEELVVWDPGQWVAATTAALQQIERQAPMVLLLDEVDRLVRTLSQHEPSVMPVAYRVINCVVAWLRNRTVPVFVSITAFDLRSLHPDLLIRGPWLDEIFFIDLPTPAERAQILQLHIGKKGRKATAYDIPTLVDVSEGFSGAQLEKAIQFGLFEAFNEQRELTTGDIMRCLQTMPAAARSMARELADLRERAPNFASLAGAAEEVKPAANMRTMRAGPRNQGSEG